MTDAADAVVYRYEPRFEGEFFRGVPTRDLTRADVARLDPGTLRNALAPHPLYGAPLYVKPGDDGKPPKWFQTKQEQVGGAVIAPLLPGETKQQYEDRIAALEAAANAPDVVPGEDETP